MAGENGNGQPRILSEFERRKVEAELIKLAMILVRPGESKEFAGEIVNTVVAPGVPPPMFCVLVSVPGRHFRATQPIKIPLDVMQEPPACLKADEAPRVEVRR